MRLTQQDILDQAQLHLTSLVHHLELTEQDPQLLLDGASLRLSAIIDALNLLDAVIRAEVIDPVQWSAMKGLRNRLVHAYGFIDPQALLTTITNRTPELSLYLVALHQRLES